MLFSVCPGIVSTISWTNKKKKTLSSSSLLLQCAAYLPAGNLAAVFFPLPRLLQCRQAKWISASIPEIDSTQASLRAINLRRAAGR